MKLSELLSKPIKVKGGGILNLKGISKHIVDKEVSGGESDDINVLAKYGCVQLFDYGSEDVEKIMFGDKNKVITITADDIINYQTEANSMINSHIESGDIESHMLANIMNIELKNIGLRNVIVYDLIPDSLSNITLDVNVETIFIDPNLYTIPRISIFSAEYKNKQLLAVVPPILISTADSKFTDCPPELLGLAFIADIFYNFEDNTISMPALYIDTNVEPSEDYTSTARFVWVTIGQGMA